MNCTHFQNMMDDYIDGSLSTIQLSDFQSHMNQCSSCRYSLIKALSLAAALKDIPVPSAKHGYEKRVLSFITQKQQTTKSNKSGFIAGFGTAIAASFALWLVFSPFSVNTPASKNMSSVNLLVQKEQTIDLVFNLPRELSEAVLTIELPNKVEIVGHIGKRQLSWKTSLKKGTNRLALPLIATGKNNGILTASLSKNGKTKTFQININVQAPTSSLLLSDVFVMS